MLDDMTELTIGELSERSGVATSAIRYYEDLGLVCVTSYDGQPAPLRARRCCAASPSSAPPSASASRLEEIEAALATLPSNRTPTKADWTRLSRGWRPRLDAQIHQLERLRDTLDSCIGCGCLSLRRCALSNPDDEVADRGPGAVFLDGPLTRRRRH